MSVYRTPNNTADFQTDLKLQKHKEKIKIHLKKLYSILTWFLRCVDLSYLILISFFMIKIFCFTLLLKNFH